MRPVDELRRLLEPGHPELSLAGQCRLLSLSRSTAYYGPRERLALAGDVRLKNQLDAIYTDHPFYGVRRMVVELSNRGHPAGPKRVRRLLREMGLEAVYPKPSLSRPAAGHRVYPYLLREVKVVRPDQVWSADITYIRMRSGFLYLVAVIDWYSRYVLDWELSNSLDASFCLDVLDRCLALATPDIFNTDQGCQFTSEAFVGRLLAAGTRVSMDGRGRALDNVFVERLWRSVKYEEVYLREYGTVREAAQGLGKYFEFYNHRRPHQSLDYVPPVQVYQERGERSPELTIDLCNISIIN